MGKGRKNYLFPEDSLLSAYAARTLGQQKPSADCGF
jgi:hypothetical protein